MDDFGCLPPPRDSSQVVMLMRVQSGVGAEKGAGLEAASAWGREGGEAGLGHPDCDLVLKDFRNGLEGQRRQEAWHLSRYRGPCHPWDSPIQGERAHVRSSSPTWGSSCALEPEAVGKPGAAAARGPAPPRELLPS